MGGPLPPPQAPENRGVTVSVGSMAIMYTTNGGSSSARISDPLDASNPTTLGGLLNTHSPR
eukprot:421132-Prorocentrum_minimum.AAC.2